MKNITFQLIIGILLFLTINTAEGKYTLSDILDASTRVKNYILKNKDLPKIVRVVSDEVKMVQFTYAMAVAIKNIHENKKEDKISLIKLEAPTSIHECNKKVDLKDYIDAVDRTIKFCKEKGAAPAYVTSLSVEIGYREYAFGFSKILDYYHDKKQLPLSNVFDSAAFKEKSSPSTPETPVVDPTKSKEKISGVEFVRGINDHNTEKDIKKYITETNNRSHINVAIKDKARELTKGLNSPLQKARAIFNFVKLHITYEKYSSSKYGAAKTLINRRGNCSDQTNLLVALCRAAKIPVRYSHGQRCYFTYSKTYAGHVWGQILIGNVWYAADTTSRNNELGFIKNWNYRKFSDLKTYVTLPF